MNRPGENTKWICRIGASGSGMCAPPLLPRHAKLEFHIIAFKGQMVEEAL